MRKGWDDDPVGITGWLMRVVTAAERTIPGVEEGNGCEWEDVCFFRKLGHWRRQGEEEAGEEDGEEMHIDTDVNLSFP